MAMSDETTFASQRTLEAGPGPVAWSHYTDHYLMAPWQSRAHQITRAFLSPRSEPIVTKLWNAGSTEHPDVRLSVESTTPISSATLDWATRCLIETLGLADDVTDFYDRVVPGDRVLAAAADHGLRGARLKISPTVFEAVLTAVASQNVHFTRTFQVMDRLVKAFGMGVPFTDGMAYTFPGEATIATAGEEELRACGLGYRARLVSRLARRLTAEGTDLDSLRRLSDTEEIRDALLDLPGIGPFTADLVLSIGFRRPAFHLDSYTRTILSLLYGLDKGDDDQLAGFVEDRFGGWKHYAMLLLTTDTHIWAAELGVELPVRSYARYRLAASDEAQSDDG